MYLQSDKGKFLLGIVSIGLIHQSSNLYTT